MYTQFLCIKKHIFCVKKFKVLKISGYDIKIFREKLGWSQPTLAEKVGVSFRTIQNYEGGHAIPESKQKLFAHIMETHAREQPAGKPTDLTLLDVMDYLHENREMVLQKESFKELLKSFAKDIALEDIKKELEQLKNKVDRITNG
ncbi:helix-turn-helix protein [Thalassospira sp. 11-3]|nr:helix-turn-helix protein [Thalassospira sp. 11-3]